MSKLPDRSDLLHAGGLPGAVDRMLASPDYGEAFSFLCQEASRLAFAYANTRLSEKSWRGRYTTGERRVLSAAAEQMDVLLDWFRKIAEQCPGTRDRLICPELLQRLVPEGSAPVPQGDNADASLRAGDIGRDNIRRQYGKDHQA